MRPIWSGERYEYGVEISRRLKTMFWMLDKQLQPFYWGRQVALALLRASKHVPVVVDICKWYLSIVPGPDVVYYTGETFSPAPKYEDISFTNPDSYFYNYIVEGDLNERGVSEFLADYSISTQEYEDFKTYLWGHKAVLVNLDHIVLRKIAALE
jgi:hypothetical protein